uniref:phage portal protein n=1 Tax=Eisenbergiella sp. TaxID=1924109 RepID=UPI003AB32EE4
MINGYTPIYSTFGNDIYVSDVVQQSIRCIVREMVKLTPAHVRVNGSDVESLNDDLQRVLSHPNQLMSKSEFLEKVMWLWIMDYNAWIIPVYDTWTGDDGIRRKTYRSFYPVRPSMVEWTEDSVGDLWVKMTFANHYQTELPYADVIHLRYDFSLSEFMGGGVDGKPNYEALLKTLQTNDSMLNGIERGMKSSYAVNGVAKYNTMLDKGATEAALKELEGHLLNGESGILPMDIKGEYIPINRDIKLVDADTLKFIDEKITRWFGVSIPILSGDYTKAQYEAFYQKTLEPFITQLSDGFTNKLFTARQLRYGHEIRWMPKNLIFMDIDQTLEMIRLLGDTGALYENEKRVALGLQPMVELNGIRKQSLNYVDTEIANEYQINNAGGGGNGSNSSTGPAAAGE